VDSPSGIDWSIYETHRVRNRRRSDGLDVGIGSAAKGGSANGVSTE
jgi:hypothetical protein